MGHCGDPRRAIRIGIRRRLQLGQRRFQLGLFGGERSRGSERCTGRQVLSPVAPVGTTRAFKATNASASSSEPRDWVCERYTRNPITANARTTMPTTAPVIWRWRVSRKSRAVSMLCTSSFSSDGAVLCASCQSLWSTAAQCDGVPGGTRTVIDMAVGSVWGRHYRTSASRVNI